MAHAEKTKAAAYAMLLTGHSCRYVASQLDVPLSTVGRWRQDAWREYGPGLRSLLERRAGGSELIALGQRLKKYGTKKGKAK